MSLEATQKVRAPHLKRNAYLYIRQSSPRQVLENTEARNANMYYGSGRWRWGGRTSRSS